MTERTTRVDRAIAKLRDIDAKLSLIEGVESALRDLYRTPTEIADFINDALRNHSVPEHNVSRQNVWDWRKKYIDAGDPDLVVQEIEEETKPRVLTLDIETAPNLAFVWGLFKENIPLARLEEVGHIISWSAKFMDEDRVYSSDDRDPDMMGKLADLINDSDVLIHYNGLGFDMPWIRTEIVRVGGQPLKPVREIDLLRTVRKQFRFTSNKLDHVAEQLLGEKKFEHSGFELWRRVMQGDPEAYAEMIEYNEADVVLTEKLYKRIAQWIKNPVNMALISGNPDGCVYCGHTLPGNNVPTGTVYTRVQSYDSYRCNHCGAINRDNSKTSVPMRYRSVAA